MIQKEEVSHNNNKKPQVYEKQSCAVSICWIGLDNVFCFGDKVQYHGRKADNTSTEVPFDVFNLIECLGRLRNLSTLCY